MPDKPTDEDLLREDLKSVVKLIEVMGAHCASAADLLGVAKLALENDGQLRWLIAEMSRPPVPPVPVSRR